MTAYRGTALYLKELLPNTIMVKGTKFTHTHQNIIHQQVFIIHVHTHTHTLSISMPDALTNIESALMKEMEDTISFNCLNV